MQELFPARQAVPLPLIVRIRLDGDPIAIAVLATIIASLVVGHVPVTATATAALAGSRLRLASSVPRLAHCLGLLVVRGITRAAHFLGLSGFGRNRLPGLARIRCRHRRQLSSFLRLGLQLLLGAGRLGLLLDPHPALVRLQESDGGASPSEFPQPNNVTVVACVERHSTTGGGDCWVGHDVVRYPARPLGDLSGVRLVICPVVCALLRLCLWCGVLGNRVKEVEHSY